MQLWADRKLLGNLKIIFHPLLFTVGESRGEEAGETIIQVQRDLGCNPLKLFLLAFCVGKGFLPAELSL